MHRPAGTLAALALLLLVAGVTPVAGAASADADRGVVQARGLQDVVDPDDETGSASGSAVAPTQPSWASLLVAGPVLGLLVLAAWTLAPRPRSGSGGSDGSPEAATGDGLPATGQAADGPQGPYGEAPDPEAPPGSPGRGDREAGEEGGVDAFGFPTGDALPGGGDPDDAQPGVPRILLLGKDAVDEGELEDAVEWFETALAAEPDLPVAHLCRGLALAEMGDHEEAAGAFRSAAEADPGNPAARYLLAASLAQSGSTREAIVHVRQVVDLVPQLADLAREDDRFAPLRDDPRFLAALGDL